MIDPQRRWRPLDDKPDYAGFLSFGGALLAQEPEHLAGVDVAIVGAPTDDLVSDRPGTRFAPRAIRAASCPPGPHLEAGIDAFAALSIVDYGDAPVIPADPARTHAAIKALVGEVVDAGALPVTLGGDHSITEPCIAAIAERRGPVGLDPLRHAHGHGPRGLRCRALARDADVPPRRSGSRRRRGGTRRSVCAGTGRAGRVRVAASSTGSRASSCTTSATLGIRSVVERALAHVGEGPVYLTVDVDVLDPAFAPGTGTPEPGGMTSVDLLWAVREIASRVELVGADVVEVLPTAVGSADITALVAERVVREVLTGLALRRGAEPST